MKRFFRSLTKHWLAKLITLVLATVIWYLIDKQVNENPRLYQDTLYKDTWTD